MDLFRDFLKGLTCLLIISSFSLSAQELEFEQFTKSEINMPVEVANAGDDRMFVVEQLGRIHVVTNDGTVLGTPFLDIEGRVPFDDGQHGLLGLAFSPDYDESGYFYVCYIGSVSGNESTIVSRFSVSEGDPNVADSNSEEIIFSFEQTHPGRDHKAGCIQFGPDGYLYIATGDGGKSTDGVNSQDLSNHLGALLRIDVVGQTTYEAPEDNPFVGASGEDEIWAYGLRNPWKFSFDKQTGDLYIGDVGGDRWDEIHYQEAGSAGGTNYGWPCFEADEVWEGLPEGRDCPDISETELPILTFFQAQKAIKVTIIGGFVYRGSLTPYFNGHYIYSEAYSGEVFHAYEENGQWVKNSFGTKGLFMSAFGQDDDGELYGLALKVPGFAEEGNHLYKVKLTAPSDAKDIVLSKNTASVSETGTTQEIGVSLSSEPSGDVTLKIISADDDEVSVSPASLVFTPSNYGTPQTITLTGVDDSDKDGDATVNVTVAVDLTNSADYTSTSAQVITVVNADDEGVLNVRPTNHFSDLNIFPNPANSVFQISGLKNRSLEITDISGKQMIWSGTETESGDVLISGLKSGIYVLKITDIELNLVKAQKLIIR